MKIGRAATVVVGLALALARPAWAQATGTEEREIESTSRIEVGGGLGAVWVPYGGGGGAWFPSLQARANISPKFAVDVVTTFDPTKKHGVEGMYLLQVHQTVGAPTPRVSRFVTYGVTGGFEYVHVSERRFSYYSGDTIVFPAYRRGEISRPIGFVGGGGYRVRLANHLFLEAGAQALIPFGYWVPVPLFNAGVIVPIGK